MTITLWELTDKYQELLELLESSDCDPETIADTMDAVSDSIHVKMENIAKAKINLEAQIEMLGNEIKRLSDMKKRLETNLANMMQYAEYQLQKTDLKEVKTPIGTWKFRKKPVYIEITDESKVPEEFVKIEKKVDKRGLTKHIKAMLEETHGEIPDTFEYTDMGVKVVNNEMSLHLKR